MKKRIIASTMASVMALSGAASALVASADVADFKNQAANKADLKKLMEDPEIKALVEGGVNNYGSISGANFLKAVDFANAVINGAEATGDDATVAYLMVKATKAALKQYTKEELQLLVAELRPKYDTNNVLNERNDARFKDDDWTKFKNAFEEADDYKDYDDILLTTDAYERLDDARDPEELPTKTKREIDAARANYEAALRKEFEFQPWQRGTISGTDTDYDGLQFAWGALYAHILSGRDETMEVYDTFDQIKGLNVTSDPEIVAAVDAMNEAATVLNGFSAKLETGNSGASVNRLLAEYQGQMVYAFGNNLASRIAANYVSVAGGAGKVEFKVNGEWKSLDAPTVNAPTFRDTYMNVVDTATIEYKPLGDNGVADSGEKYTAKVEKIGEASLEVRTKDNGKVVYYVLDRGNKLPSSNGALWGIDSDSNHEVDKWFWDSAADAEQAAKAAGLSYDVKPINLGSGFKISDYIPVTAYDVLVGVAPFGKAAYDTAVDDLATAKADVQRAINALYSVPDPDDPRRDNGTLKDDLDEINGYITKISDALADTALSADRTVRGKLSALNSEAGKVKKAVEDAIKKAKAGTIKESDVKKINTALGTPSAGLKAALAAAITAASGINPDATAWKTAPVMDASSTAATTLKTELADLTSAQNSVNTAWDAFVVEGMDFNNSDLNMVFDMASEVYFKLSSGKTDKGLKFFYQGASRSAFELETPYASSRNNTNGDDPVHITTPSLAHAVAMVYNFNNNRWKGIKEIDNTMYITSTDVERIPGTAWQLLYNYLKYALEDQFKADAAKSYTKKDVKDLLDKSYKLATDTVDTSLFTYSHMDMFNDRNGASDWYKLAEADKGKYKDYKTQYRVVTNDTADDYDSTAMYKKLKDTYDQLNKEFKAFKYSYGEIVEQIALIAKNIDSGSLSEDAKATLASDLEEVAAAFVKVEPVKFSSGADLDDSELFNANGTINKHNRLFTNEKEFNGLMIVDSKTKVAESKGSDKPNHTHYVMQKAYEKLIADYEAATTAPVDKVTTDVDGNGKFELADVQEMLKIYTNGKGEVSKHDFNKDGKVSLDDVVALLKQYTNK